MSNAAKLYLTEGDYKVLESVVEKYSGLQGEFLENELAQAEVVSVDEIPDNVVTLYSRTRVVDETNATERDVTVLPPGESSSAIDGKISVLSPLGAALIGLSEGQVIEWPMPSGRNLRFRVKKVLYQPEAARRVAQDGLTSVKGKDSSGVK